jgi:hypothetical protein
MTTLTTMVSKLSWTINKLLFWEGKELTSLNGMSWFQSFNSSEGPTWSTWCLILDWGDFTLLSPIDSTIGILEYALIEFNNVGLTISWLVSEELLDFFWSPVSEVVNSDLVVVLSIVLIELLESLNEDISSESVFFFSSVLSSVWANEFKEFSLSWVSSLGFFHEKLGWILNVGSKESEEGNCTNSSSNN